MAYAEEGEENPSAYHSYFPNGDVGEALSMPLSPLPPVSLPSSSPSLSHVAPTVPTPKTTPETPESIPVPSYSSTVPISTQPISTQELTKAPTQVQKQDSLQAPIQASTAAPQKSPQPAQTPLQTSSTKVSLDSIQLPILQNNVAEAEALKLAHDFVQEVPSAQFVPTAYKTEWIHLTRQQLNLFGYVVRRPQVIVVVDRNPHVQRLCLVLALPHTDQWQIIGSTRISTGRTGRKHYYITPTGVFTNTVNRLGYRALGTKNQNGIMGNGVKGMRVWDFGWQMAEKGWLPNHEKGLMRLEMHATDPVYLEHRLGHVASAGCIRIPSALDVFIDRHGLLDADYEHQAAIDRRFKAVLRSDRIPSPISGLAVVVVDTTGLVTTPLPHKFSHIPHCLPHNIPSRTLKIPYKQTHPMEKL